MIDIGLLLLVITLLLSTVTATVVVVKQLAKGKSTERPQTQTHIMDSPTSKQTPEETHSESEEIQVPGKPTGKPAVKHVTTNSVTLSWEEPDTNSELVTGYSVLYCIVKGSNQKPPSDAKWSQYSVFGNMRTAEVKGLRSNVTYVFKVRPESENGSGQESDLSKTKTEQSLADYVRSKSQVIKEKEGLHILKPPIQRRKSAKGKRKSPSFTRCDIIGKSKQVDAPSEKVLLVVGATGAGKSTLINGIANYIMGVSWNDDFRFQVIVDEKEASQAQSQTKKVTAYSFHGSTLPYILTVIDTPGFGDTEGMDRDKITVNQIKELFSTHSPECVDQIHGVGFVIQASSPRLTQSQRFIFDSVLSIFGKDIASNIFLMMTFADSQKPPVLSAIKEAAIPYQQGFAFNNSALYANHSEGGSSIDEMFWNLGKKNFSLFFTEFEKAEAHSLQLTRENLNERQQLEVIVEGLKLQIRVALTKIDVLRQKKQILRRREADILRNENFEYELTVTKQRLVDLPSNVSVTNCTTCNFTCHYPCPIAEDKEKYRCKAMDSGGQESAHCTVCPGNCPWSQHVNASQRFELYYVVETHTSDELKKNLSDAIQGKNEIEAIISDIEKELEMLQGVIVGMVREAKRSLERLQEIALKPNPLSETEYIDLLIKDEKSEKRPGYIERIKAFEIVKTMVKEHNSKGGRKPDSSWWKDVTK